MRLKSFLLLFLVPVLFSCNKGSDADTVTVSVDSVAFAIEGLQDIVLVTDTFKTEASITLNVVQTSGKPESITLSIADLPPGIYASLTQPTGTPPFSTELRLTKKSSTKKGSYPVTISAKSASFSRSGTINLTIPELNGFTFDGIDYEQFFMPGLSNNGPIGTIWLFEGGMGNATRWDKYVVGFGVGQPYLADSVYSYKIISDNKHPREEGEISYWFINRDSTGEHTYRSEPSSTRYAILTVSGGKYSIIVPPTEMYENGDTNRPMKILSVNAWMK